jgi:hypothetical protein
VTPRDQIRHLYPFLNPFIAAGDPRLPTVRRVDRPYSPLDALVRDLRRPGEPRKELLYGPPGSGKSTEVLAMVARTARNHLAVFLDLRAHFEEQRGDAAAIDHLQPWEVLAVIGLAVHRFAEEACGFTWPSGETQALATALAAPTGAKVSEINVAKLAAEVSLLVLDSAAEVLGPGGTWALKALKAVAGNVSASLPLGLPGSPRLQDQDSRVQQLKHAVTRLLTVLFQNYNQRVLLVVDGLDRGSAEMAERLFEDSQLLYDLPCNQLLCAPQSLRRRNIRGYRPRPICNLPVASPIDPQKEGSGISFFVELWQSRAEAAEVPASLLPEPAVRRLAWASGGFVRDFLEMVQDAVDLAWDDDSAVTEAHVAAVVDAWRRRWEEGLGTTKLAALAEVARHRNHDDSDLHRQLLQERCIVAFPNESEWYLPHPLLLLKAVPWNPLLASPGAPSL